MSSKKPFYIISSVIANKEENIRVEHFYQHFFMLFIDKKLF